MTDQPAVTITHNLDPSEFVWLWVKYVRGVNLAHHCTNSIRGRYSKVLSKHNPNLASMSKLVLDEQPWGSFEALYVCGVAKRGYRKKENYPHNLHTAIFPASGSRDVFRFEKWRLSVENGKFFSIPAEDSLPSEFAFLPKEFTTCRIFRFAVALDRMKRAVT